MTSILKVTEIQDPTNSNTALTIDSSGNVLRPQKIAFMSKLDSSFNPGTASRTVIPFKTNNSADRVFNFGNGFDSTNNRFVAPVAGLYLLFSLARVDSHSTSYFHILRFTLNGSVINEGYYIMVPNSSSYQSSYIQCYVNMSVNDYVDVRTQSQGDSSYSLEQSSTHFSGHFIG
jgi:hypothetical protein